MRIKYRPEDFIVRECFRAFDRDGDGDHGVYSLEKKKLTTFEAIDELARKLKVPKREIAVAGLKDRQSMSAQLVSIPGPRVQYSTYRLTLRYLGRTDEPIKSEANLANRFTLTVRELTHDDLNVFDANLPIVQELGLPNYFDDQRFGCLRFGQGFVVRDMLAGRYEQALRKLIGTPLASDRKSDRDLKGFIGTMWGKWDGLAERIDARQKWHYVIEHLRDNPSDFAGAFAHLGTRFKTIHLFAYQSYLFNEALSNFLYDALPTADARAGVPYAGGNLTVWKTLPTELYAQLLEQGLTFPLLAHDTKLEDPRIRRACEKVLKRENIAVTDLKFKNPDVLFYKTEQRPIALRPQALKVDGPFNDREFRGRKMLRLTFELPRGAYASLVIKRLFVGAQLRDLLAPHAAGVDPEEESHGYDRGFYGRSQPSKKRIAEEKSRSRGGGDRRPNHRDDGDRRPNQRDGGERWAKGPRQAGSSTSNGPRRDADAPGQPNERPARQPADESAPKLEAKTESEVVQLPVERTVDRPAQRTADRPPQRRDDRPPQRRDDRAPQRRDDRAPQRRDDRAPQRRDDRAPQRRDDRAPQRRDDRAPQRRDDRPSQRRDDRAPQRRDDRPPQRRDDRAPQRRDDRRSTNRATPTSAASKPRSNRPQPPKPGESRPVRKRRFVAPTPEPDTDD